MCMPSTNLLSRCAKHGGLGNSSGGCTVCHTTWAEPSSDNISRGRCLQCGGELSTCGTCPCFPTEDPSVNSTGPLPTFTPVPQTTDGCSPYPPEPVKTPFVCPVCDGTTKISCPPHLAPSVVSWADYDGDMVCDCPACKDSPGVVWG
jgi:hypothetical protein